MNSIWLQLAATAVAAALTWWCCVRLMARNRSCQGTPPDAGLQEELRAARAELPRLRDEPTPPALRAGGPEILDR